MASTKTFTPEIETKLDLLVDISGQSRDFFIDKLSNIDECEYISLLDDEICILEAPGIIQGIKDGTIETFPFPEPLDILLESVH